MRVAFKRLSKRMALLALGLVGAVVLASSCSLDAALTTDRSGRVISLHGIRLQSTLHDFGLEMLVRGGELVFEFSWGRELEGWRSVDRFAGAT